MKQLNVSETSQLQAHLVLLGKHADVIVHAYREKTVRRTLDNKNSIEELSAKRVLMPTAEPGTYSLASDLFDHLKVISKRNRIFGSARDCSHLIQHLSDVRRQYSEENVLGGSEEKLQDLEDDFHATVHKLFQEIDDQLQSFGTTAQSEFGHARSSASRRRQNQEAIKWAELLGEAIQMVGDKQVLAEYDKNPRVQPLWEVFQRELLSQRRRWNDQLGIVLDVLKKYLNKQREFNRRAQHFHQVASKIRKGLFDAEFAELNASRLEGSHARWLAPVAPFKQLYFPSLEDQYGRGPIEDVAEKLPRDAQIARAAKARVEERAPTPRALLEAQVVPEADDTSSPLQGLPPEEIALGALFMHVASAGSKVSVIQWLLDHHDYKSHNPDGFLAFVLAARHSDSKKFVMWPKVLECEPVFASVANKCALAVVTDLVVWKKG